MFNENGLTWIEWFRAATYIQPLTGIPNNVKGQMLKEWEAGVDPYEWTKYWSDQNAETERFLSRRLTEV